MLFGGLAVYSFVTASLLVQVGTAAIAQRPVRVPGVRMKATIQAAIRAAKRGISEHPRLGLAIVHLAVHFAEDVRRDIAAGLEVVPGGSGRAAALLIGGVIDQLHQRAI